MGKPLSWGLTFDMSGIPQAAKPAVGCPLDGAVRRARRTRRHGLANEVES